MQLLPFHSPSRWPTACEIASRAEKQGGRSTRCHTALLTSPDYRAVADDIWFQHRISIGSETSQNPHTVPPPGRATGQHQAAKVQCKADTQRAEGKANNGTPSQVAVGALGKHQACSAVRGSTSNFSSGKKEEAVCRRSHKMCNANWPTGDAGSRIPVGWGGNSSEGRRKSSGAPAGKSRSRQLATGNATSRKLLWHDPRVRSG